MNHTSTPSTRRHESHRRGVNATQYNPGKRSKSLRAKFGADDSNVVVLWAARLVPEKGADLFADAFVALFNNKTLLEHYPGVIDRIRIVVVGSGPSRAQMEAALPPDRTVFFGHLVGTGGPSARRPCAWRGIGRGRRRSTGLRRATIGARRCGGSVLAWRAPRTNYYDCEEVWTHL
jgi:hypothetical protein